MKRTINKQHHDELRKEYDFQKLEEGIRGKYANEFRKGTNLVLIEPKVAKVFPTTKDVNNALKLLIKITANQQDKLNSDYNN